MSNKAEQLGFMNQFPVKKDVASWRQIEVTISGLALKTITFSDTTPNMFFIQNPNDVSVLVGISHIPTNDSYEFRVDVNSSKTFGRPVPTSTLHLLNPSNKEITISLFSVNDTFDISVLQSSTFDFSGMSIDAFDGIIKGFSSGVSLPSGTNNLGFVHVATLPEGTNHIGEVALDSASVELLTGVKESLETIHTEFKNVLATIANGQNISVTDMLSFEGEESVSYDFTNANFIPNYINYIANDGTSDITVNVIIGATSHSFTLKEGESFGDINAVVSGFSVRPKTDGESIAYRAMFSLRG